MRFPRLSFVFCFKVLDVVRAVETLAQGPIENSVPPKSPTSELKTTTIVMSKHTLATQPSTVSYLWTSERLYTLQCAFVTSLYIHRNDLLFLLGYVVTRIITFCFYRLFLNIINCTKARKTKPHFVRLFLLGKYFILGFSLLFFVVRLWDDIKYNIWLKNIYIYITLFNIVYKYDFVIANEHEWLTYLELS